MRTLLILAIFQIALTANAYQVIISGVVTDINQGNYVVNQEMVIEFESDMGIGFYYYNIVTTNQTGFYTDTVFVTDSIEGTVKVSTYDCGIIAIAEEWYTPESNYIVIDFEICVDPTSECEAFFNYYRDFESFTVQFQDLSIGSIDDWYWDFGDGTTSVEQNPIHEFPDEGNFLTSLTISGDSCLSEYEILINVIFDTISECEASFVFENIQNSNTVYFFDTSFGFITLWLWDFGDGTTSFEQNPVHTYSNEGQYTVSLFIESIDSCTDFIIDYIWVGTDTNCTADFEYALDTLNNIPHTFIFTDLSTGDFETWYWDFGDGSYSYEQNPVHVYENEGVYSVYLTVSSQSGTMPCTSFIEYQISTIEYYNFGGQAFIENYPINIDSNDNENIAVAYLYRKINNSWEYMDNKEFWKYGYYWFSDKPVGEYIIRTELKENSLDYDLFAPVYHMNSTSWKDASVFILSNEEQFAVNVSLKEMVPFNTGIGRITGNVEGSLSCDSLYNINLNHVLIQLFNDEEQIIAYTFTDSNGLFEFNGIGSGNFIIKAEYPGRYTETTSITLTINDPNIDEMELMVYCSHILGVTETIADEIIHIAPPMPNPVSDILKISYNSKVDAKGKIFIQDLNGNIIVSVDIGISSGVSTLSIDVQSIPNGIYFLNSTFQEHSVQKIIKIIIIH
jgi:PKD repeat protein